MEQSYPQSQPALEASRANVAPAIEEPGPAHTFGWFDGARIAVVAIAALLVRLHLGEPLTAVIGIACVAIGGWPIFKEAAENLLARRMTSHTS